MTAPPGHNIWHGFCLLLFFFNDTATTEIYTLSLHDALPISTMFPAAKMRAPMASPRAMESRTRVSGRSEEHTSELQSRQYLVCRLLLEKKKNTLHERAAYVSMNYGVSRPPASTRDTELRTLA